MKKIEHPFFSTPLLIGCIIVLLLIGFTPYFLSLINPQDTLAQGIVVGTIDAHDMNESALRDALENFQRTISDYGIPSTVDSETAVLHEPQSLDSDIPVQEHNALITIDVDSTIRRAFAYGRSSSPVNDALNRAKLLFLKNTLPIEVSINRELLAKTLEQAFPKVLRQPVQADLSYNKTTKTFDVVKEQSGTFFDVDSAVQSITNSLAQGNMPNVQIKTMDKSPNIISSDAEKFRQQAQHLLRPIQLTVGDKRSWKVDAPTVGLWITVSRTPQTDVALAVRGQEIKKYLETTIAPAVFVEGKDPRFEMKGGKIFITTQPQKGSKLEIEESVRLISTTILDKTQSTILLPIKEYESAALDIPSQNNIKEIVSKAETDFRGSPKNRRANIANGISRINGIIIQPNEEFSLLHYLEPIDDTTGFLPELVIKGNKTKPEFGGGLCQVSTTLFRAVAYAGLPVTMRRNHSYRVSYYEPPVGFDATIYSPAPDFKFKNDMATPLLIQARIQGTKVFVTFWGTKDGRISDIDKPTVYNIKKPPEMKLIETTELKPGEKKCTEKAHSGADAYFERRVTYPSGEVKKDLFKSHYVVWPAVCYIGKEKVEPPPEVLIEN